MLVLILVINNDWPVCPSSKQTMLPFPQHSSSHASQFFSLIHMDLWGPYHVAKTHGCKYFLTLVDDYSHATWTFLLSTKQNVFSTFKDFNAYVQYQFFTNIHTIRTNNGSEFINHQFHSFLFDLGI